MTPKASMWPRVVVDKSVACSAYDLPLIPARYRKRIENPLNCTGVLAGTLPAWVVIDEENAVEE
jgi:hypothetical protein